MTGTTCAPHPGHHAAVLGEAVQWGDRRVCTQRPAPHSVVLAQPCPRCLAGFPTTGPCRSDLSSLTTGPSRPFGGDSGSPTPVSLSGVLALTEAPAAPALLAQSLCNDSPSLARLVDLHQSNRMRTAELGLRSSYGKRGAGPGLFQPQPFRALLMPRGLSLILTYTLGLREGAARGCFSLQACGMESDWREREHKHWDSAT